jgi:uncharacterized protein with NAD-binding domain and iron-sulfur cluster
VDRETLAAMAPPAGERTRVLCIGGGPAALAAVYELTADGRASEYEVTILQPGWRLGGKCASGRNASRGERIEEHGLHVWFGCYDNARALLGRCYEELHRDPAQFAFTSMEDAFEGLDLSVLWQRRGGAWSYRQLQFPRHRLPPPNFLGFAVEAITWAGRSLLDLQASLDADETVDFDLAALIAPAHEVFQLLGIDDPMGLGPAHRLSRVASRLQRGVAQLFVDTAAHAGDLGELAGLLDGFHDLVKSVLPERVRDRSDVVFYMDTVDLLIATLKGVWADDLLQRGFDTINDRDLAQWLKSHGAELADDPIEWPAVLRGVYDGCFAFDGGDPDTPSMAAGRALQGAVRCLLHYRGSVLYRMRSGMGDTVIAPLYEALERRNREEDGRHCIRRLTAAASPRSTSWNRSR